MKKELARAGSAANKHSKKKSPRRKAGAKRLMTMRDIAKRYGCCEQKIRVFRRAGLLPPPCPLSSDGKYLWHPLVIERWMRREVLPDREQSTD